MDVSRKIIKKRIIVNSFFAMILTILLIGFSSSKVVSAQDDLDKLNSKTEQITENNYKEWSSPNLKDALDKSTQFLSANLTNEKWTKGSLNALASVIEYAQEEVKSVLSSDLIREQLIQTVRKLEKKIAGDFVGTFNLDNNYPSNTSEYGINYEIKKNDASEGEKYDIVFLVELSQMMGWSVGYIKNPKAHAILMMKSMANKLFKENTGDIRMRIIGLGTAYTNQETAGPTGRPIETSTFEFDTGYFNKNSDYMSIIGNLKLNDPKHGGHNIPLSILEATNLMRNNSRKGATPYLFVFSTFGLRYVGNDVTGTYITNLLNYKNVLKNATNKDPIYYGIHYASAPGDTVSENPIFSTPGWGYQSIISSTNSENAISEFTNLIKEKIKYDKWETGVESFGFKYISGSFSSITADKLIYDYEPVMMFQGPKIASGIGKYKIKFKHNVFSETVLKKGNTVPYYSQANIYLLNTQNKYSFRQNPQLFVPITDLAIELLEYKGEGDISDSNNYNSSKCIVSNEYNPYGGNSYSLTSQKLSSIPYGETITKEKILSILKEKIGTEEFNKYQFLDENNPTQQSLTASFDSSKNVYKVYSTVKNNVSITQKNLDDTTGKNFIDNEIETTVVGTVESQFDLLDGKFSLSIPKEFSQPTKIWVNNTLIENINQYYRKDEETGLQTIEIPELNLKRNEKISVKYLSNIIDSNNENLLITTASLSGNNKSNLFTKVSEKNELVITEKPVIRIIYVDQIGNKLINNDGEVVEDKLIDGNVGSSYDVSTEDFVLPINNYELDPEQLPSNTKGLFEKKEIKVTYVYRKLEKVNQTKGSYKNQLSFTWVPKSFNLGSRRALLLNNVFELNNKEKQWLVVNENRDKKSVNFGKKWQVKARMDPLKSLDGKIIKGSQFYFDINGVKEYHIGDQMNALKTDIVPNNPNNSNAIEVFPKPPAYIEVGGETLEDNSKLIKLQSTGEEVTILEQNQNLIDGEVTGYAIQLENQRLIVPRVEENDYNKEFDSVITWTLSRDISL